MVGYIRTIDMYQGLVRAVTLQRGTRLVLALQAYRLEHGSLPHSLDVLVGDYFEQLPVDPYTGESFGYYPNGLAVETEVYPDSVAVEPVETLPAGTPFVWSAAGHQPGQYQFVRDPNHPLAQQARAEYFSRPKHYRYEEGVWPIGWPFPIPPQAASAK